MSNLPEWYPKYEQYLEVQYRSAATRTQYASRVRRWLNEGMPEVDAWASSARRTDEVGVTHGSGEYNARLAAIKSLLKFGIRHKINFNVLREDLPRTAPADHPPVVALTEKQTQIMLERLKGTCHSSTPNNLADYTFAMLCYLLMARRAEIRRLKVKDVHLDDEVPHVDLYGKGGKRRQVPLSPGAAKFLRNYFRQLRLMKSVFLEPDDFVVGIRRLKSGRWAPLESQFRTLCLKIRKVLDEMIEAGELSADMRPIMDSEGFKPIHLLRNRRASHLYQRDANVRALSIVGGWSSMSSLQRYLDYDLAQTAKQTGMDTINVGNDSGLEILEDVA